MVYKDFNKNSEHVPQFLQEYTLITYFTSLIRRNFQFFFFLDFCLLCTWVFTINFPEHS